MVGGMGRAKLEEVVGEFFARFDREGRASVSYALVWTPERGLECGKAYFRNLVLETEPFSFNDLAETVKRGVEERCGPLKHVRSIGLRGDVYANESVELTIEAGWGLLVIDAIKLG
jgi:hypothetical protein